MAVLRRAGMVEGIAKRFPELVKNKDQKPKK